MISLIQKSDVNAPFQRAEICRNICYDVSEHLNADMVSIWLFNERQDKITSVLNYDALSDSFLSGVELLQKLYPRYFKEIIENVFLSAPDVRSHPALADLWTPYFNKLNVDFTLHRDGKPLGIICVENRRSQIFWSQEQITYLRNISLLTSRHFL